MTTTCLSFITLTDILNKIQTKNKKDLLKFILIMDKVFQKKDIDVIIRDLRDVNGYDKYVWDNPRPYKDMESKIRTISAVVLAGLVNLYPNANTLKEFALEVYGDK